MASSSSRLPCSPQRGTSEEEVSDWASCDAIRIRSLCCCSDLPKDHVHCVCSQCNGLAVSRKTEYRHRMDRRSALAAKRVTELDPEVLQVSVFVAFSFLFVNLNERCVMFYQRPAAGDFLNLILQSHPVSVRRTMQWKQQKI